MTQETFERAKEIEFSLNFISESEKDLSLMEGSLNHSVYLTYGWTKVLINSELVGKLIPIIKEYYNQQAEKLEKEFKQL